MPGRQGILYVVATPIGNLGDLSQRALGTLGAVDLIAAEDTRHSRQMLRKLGIDTPLTSLHEHNETVQIDGIIRKLRDGMSIALISDAGTPLLSDPGYRLVKAARNAGLGVTPVPGASAIVAALSVAGLPTDRFVFEGFLPSRDKARREHLDLLRNETRTLVFFEAPHRLAKSLQAMCEQFGGQRIAVVAREMTKQFESFYHGPLSELSERTTTDPMMCKGETVIVVAGVAQGPAVDDNEVRRLLVEARKELPPGRAASMVSRLTGRPRREIYEMLGDSGAEPGRIVDT